MEFTRSCQEKLYDAIYESFEQHGIGFNEVKQYIKAFPRKSDYNIVEYGNLLVCCGDIKELFFECGYTDIYEIDDERVWGTYKCAVGRIARYIGGISRFRY